VRCVPRPAPDELAAFETDVLAGFVLARAAAGLADATIRSDVSHLEQLRAWFGRPLWGMEPADADAYFGTVLRDAAKGTRLGRSQALRTYFLFLELRHKIELHQMTGRVAECLVDEMNRPGGRAGRRCGSRRPRCRWRRCSPGGGGSWRPAGSSPRPPAVMRRPG
jgi:integrase/recombinase XerD